MAELILSPIADKIVGSLCSAAVREIATIWGVNDELEKLQETISLIKGVLRDAEKKQALNDGVRIWLRSIVDAVHEADDVMDEFDTEALRRQLMDGNEVSKQVCTFFSVSNQLAFRSKMGHKIKEIRKKLASASNDKSFLLLEVISPDEKSEVVRKRDTHSFVPQEEVIGREEEKEEIVKLLLESPFEERLPVIPVVGMGGLGKTTLVQSIFNDERVQQHFDVKTWVCISENFDLKVILQKITKKSNEAELDQLQQVLREKLNGKRYLLILDDVWEENREKWLELKNLLICGAEGSRVVVTTRSIVVASATSAVKPYQLRVLDKEKSWSLFRKMAFRRSEEEKSPNLVQIGNEIVERCGGIPLAIRAIGSTLYCKHSESEWSSFANELSKISQVGTILPTLRLSYDNLGSQFKQCYVYCQLFPKDYDIQVRVLIQLWMSQGFLKKSDASHDECLEDMGYRYFAELLERSFFQEVKFNEYGVVKSCKMHDLIHDLAIEVAGQEYSTGNWNSIAAMSKSVRHLSIDSESPILSSVLQPRNVRTLFFLRQNYLTDEETTFLGATIPKFKKLRALDTKRSFHPVIPECVSKSKHVRYLDLSMNTNISTLPNSITNLINLQTLKLNGCFQLRELPRDMKKLVNLMHLEIDGCHGLRHMPIGLGLLTNLITLSKFVLPVNCNSATKENGGIRELLPLNKLRGDLSIENLKYGDAEVEFAILKEKKDLQSLHLNWVETNDADINGCEMSLECLQPHRNLQKLYLYNYRGVKLPSWFQLLTSLATLSMLRCWRCTLLCPLTQFHNLKLLEIGDLRSLEYMTEWSTSHDLSSSSSTSLPSLQTLVLYHLPNLKGWWRDYAECGEENQHKLLPSFPQLTSLEIRSCPYLTCMPLYPHLEHLSLVTASLNPLRRTILECSSSFSPLTRLQTLELRDIEGVACLPEWFEGLSSLQRLEICNVFPMVSLHPGILHLTSLKNLKISSIDFELNNVDDMIWKALNGSLEILWLEDFPKLETLPQGVSHLVSLQHLTFRNWEALAAIPEWIGDLRSLERLEFTSCLNLASLPEAIRSLTSLKTLDLSDSPVLTERCQTQIGIDWPKISHIPTVYGIPDHNEDQHPVASEAAPQKKWKLLKGCLP